VLVARADVDARIDRRAVLVVVLRAVAGAALAGLGGWACVVASAAVRLLAAGVDAATHRLAKELPGVRTNALTRDAALAVTARPAAFPAVLLIARQIDAGPSRVAERGAGLACAATVDARLGVATGDLTAAAMALVGDEVAARASARGFGGIVAHARSAGAVLLEATGVPARPAIRVVVGGHAGAAASEAAPAGARARDACLARRASGVAVPTEPRIGPLGHAHAAAELGAGRGARTEPRETLLGRRASATADATIRLVGLEIRTTARTEALATDGALASAPGALLAGGAGVPAAPAARFIGREIDARRSAEDLAFERALAGARLTRLGIGAGVPAAPAARFIGREIDAGRSAEGLAFERALASARATRLGVGADVPATPAVLFILAEVHAPHAGAEVRWTEQRALARPALTPPTEVASAPTRTTVRVVASQVDAARVPAVGVRRARTNAALAITRLIVSARVVALSAVSGVVLRGRHSVAEPTVIGDAIAVVVDPVVADLSAAFRPTSADIAGVSRRGNAAPTGRPGAVTACTFVRAHAARRAHGDADACRAIEARGAGLSELPITQHHAAVRVHRLPPIALATSHERREEICETKDTEPPPRHRDTSSRWQPC
jgi:hypothetical protein